MVSRFYARSASDKTDEWPFWFVADDMQDGLNVTQILRTLRGDAAVNARISKPGLTGVLEAGFAVKPFMGDYDALKLARWANKTIGDAPSAMWAERAAA